MANLIPGFGSGSSHVIEIDGVQLAYVNNLSFADDMAHAPVGGIGSYNYDALEPTQYSVRGSFSIQQYTAQAVSASKSSSQTTAPKPARAKDAGNSMLKAQYFSPVGLLFQRSFDINVYERKNTAGNDVNNNLKLIFQITSCRLASYSFTFTPGQIVTEQISFIATGLVDQVALENASQA